MDNLFKFFNEMNRGNFSYIDKMDDDEVKELSPFVMLMWAHGAKDNEMVHTLLTDLYCNPYVFSLSKHPRLLLKLFVAANGEIDNTRYKFKKAKQQRGSSKEVKAIASFYGCSLKDADEYASILSKAEIKDIVDRTTLE